MTAAILDPAPHSMHVPFPVGDAVDAALQRLETIDLAQLNRCARLQTRKDRKYVLAPDEVVAVLDALPGDLRVLEIGSRRWFGYESVYFDTDDLDSYRLAATRRPRRFKVRTRTYLESGLRFAEVKTKDRRGRTVKHRLELDQNVIGPDEVVRSFAMGFGAVASYADRLEPVLTTRYRRATLALPEAGVRATLDAAYRCVDAEGASIGLENDLIIETKTSGRPSIVDHALWRAGHRPLKISKYATGLAALHPELIANRWAPVLRAHFERDGLPQHRIDPDGDVR